MNANLRDTFWDVIYERARNDSDIVIVSADLGAASLDKFRRDMPAQFISVGIAEQNAITVAAGLALSGKKVFVYACVPFIVLRCYEQIRLLISGMKLPITIVGQGMGYSFAEYGPTHHIVEDVGAIRMLPNMNIFSLSDNCLTQKVAEYTLASDEGAYVRVDKATPENIYKNTELMDLHKGFYRFGNIEKTLLIAIGSTVKTALEVQQILKEKGKNVSVMDMFRIMPDKQALVNELLNYDKVITLEEHSYPCGMGSMICEIIMDSGINTKIKRIALDHSQGYCYEYGGREYMHRLKGIDATSVAEKIVKF